jgi:hypothetical protein
VSSASASKAASSTSESDKLGLAKLAKAIAIWLMDSRFSCSPGPNLTREGCLEAEAMPEQMLASVDRAPTELGLCLTRPCRIFPTRSWSAWMNTSIA